MGESGSRKILEAWWRPRLLGKGIWKMAMALDRPAHHSRRGCPGRWCAKRGADTSGREGEAHRAPGGFKTARDAWGLGPRRNHSFSGEPIHRT